MSSKVSIEMLSKKIIKVSKKQKQLIEQSEKDALVALEKRAQADSTLFTLILGLERETAALFVKAVAARDEARDEEGRAVQANIKAWKLE